MPAAVRLLSVYLEAPSHSSNGRVILANELPGPHQGLFTFSCECNNILASLRAASICSSIGEFQGPVIHLLKKHMYNDKYIENFILDISGHKTKIISRKYYEEG